MRKFNRAHAGCSSVYGGAWLLVKMMPGTPLQCCSSCKQPSTLSARAGFVFALLARMCLQLGGVYADMDVECLKPIDEWNAQHGHDAAVLLGVENFDAKRKPHTVHVNNWAMAAMPGHPLLARFPGVVTREIQKQYFELVAQKGQMKPLQYEKGILDRTGPAAVTTAMYEYLESVGLDLNKVSEADLTGSGGVIAGGVRVLPGVALSTGWEVADARSKGLKYTCADAAAAKPQALVCHMFWGSWRSTWRTFKQRFTYENC